ncbi:TIGR02099 family protein [Psychromonas sp. psych-6C06]|uniref:YhdP family protein n=1 Tax=Psychromonas sp. psych-6C06 TaxID=2058089 RepID=UPI000C325F83|nr:YhdP family protein [Psychromonas sp. psych-6C06]PKF62258.1 TIGR02099 family protein [Psychromonas sp. psych-6C06]
MKHFTFKWLKRIYILFAIKLVIVAVLLTSARILFISVEDYKQQAIEWVTGEYEVDIAVQDISAGIDFSGMILTLNNVELLDSEELPFVLKFEHLFLHLDFWDSVVERKLNFNRISLQGAELTLNKGSDQAPSEKSQITINKLKDIFLSQLKKVSVKNSKVRYVDEFGHQKLIVINQLRWLNDGDDHQGIGEASFPDKLGTNSLKFVVDLFPENDNQPLSGNLYLKADDLDITEYLVEQVNSNARVTKAVLGFDAWAKFTEHKIDSVQVIFKKTAFSWSQLKRNYHWGISSGELQLTNSNNGWLLDSYNLAMLRDNKPWHPLTLSGKGDDKHLKININGLTIQDISPFYLLHSELTKEQITQLRKFNLDANLDQVGVILDEQNNVQFSVNMSDFNNRPVGAIPGINNATIAINGGIDSGYATIKLAQQQITFDGQFSRNMPVQSADIDLQWQQTNNGLKLFSKGALLNTDELQTSTDFSLLLANENAQNQSTFLSLYTYASLNDASKAQYYFPVKAMGESVFEYLEPTLKKGHVEGAKILWYGAFNHYPYLENNGIFQAFVPLRDAQYDFYGEWQGLTDLDLDLLFENDYLLMDAKRASLGEVEVDKLSAKVDHLNPDGILTIKADIAEDAKNISDYLKASPLKESVGKALSVLEVSQPLSGNIILTVPFNREKQQTQSEGTVRLVDNQLDIHLADNLVMPLKKLTGSFDFINGNLIASELQASLFEQPVEVDFNTEEKNDRYVLDAQLRGIWKLARLSQYHTLLAPLTLSGHLDWSGDVNFTHLYSGGYNYQLELESETQGIRTKLPAPFYKHTLQSWPTVVKITGNDSHSLMKASVADKLSFEGQLNYQYGIQSIPYFSLDVGQKATTDLDKNKQVININLEHLGLTAWYDKWRIDNQEFEGSIIDEVIEDTSINEQSLLDIEAVNVDIKHLELFEQPFALFRANAIKTNDKWGASINSDVLQTDVEYRPGIPIRIDLKAQKMNFQSLDLSLLKDSKRRNSGKLKALSSNLLLDYPELFVECERCIYKDFDLSPLNAHIYPTKKRLNIDYIKIGDETEFTNISGVWDQRLTNIIFDSEGNKDNDIIRRMGYTSPVYHQKMQLSGAVNWVGGPWQANFDTLNGAFSAGLADGAITEVSDKGTRFLSVFSLDGIRRSLNLEFDNVFAKGFSFDELTFSGNINDGVVSNDDFYLAGSAGKIIGKGLIDLPNYETNYNFSYSPAVTSSLPVLAAFAINPLTGAALLMITKLLEPVVDTIIRVDFSVKGDLSSPDVKLVTRKRGKIKLENSEVLQEMTEQHQALKGNPSEL